MKIHFQALGCRLNEAELESWSNQFTLKGHQITGDSQDADLVVLNTCSVTGEADRKSRQIINRLHRNNPDSKLIVTGCYASLQKDKVAEQMGVDMVVDNQDKDRLVDLMINQFSLPVSNVAEIDQHSIFDRGRHRAFIKVQDGCRYRCTFCIVTLARGEERSRTSGDIIDEINRHHESGVQEVVITGVHVGGYGSDLGSSLYQLLTGILDKTAIPRIRLASVEPWDLPDDFFSLFADPRVMPHMHLPLQSGSDSVLRRMARRCKTEDFAKITQLARTANPLFNVTTDLIVGFPGETDDEWDETMKFVQAVGFGDIHIFSYSPREGTKAATLPNPVDKALKKYRSDQMRGLARQMKLDSLSRLVGRRYPVLFENRFNQDDQAYLGYTPNYHRLVANINPHETGNSPVDVLVEGVYENDLLLQATIVSSGNLGVVVE